MNFGKAIHHSTESQPVNVAYSVSNWLPLTMNWIYTQIKYIEHFEPIILTETTANLDLLPDFPLFEIADRTERIVYSNLRKLGIRTIPPQYSRAIKKYDPKILHSHFGDWGWYNIPLAEKNKLQHIVTFYGYDLSLLPHERPKWRKRFLQLFRSADLFLCEGPYMAETIINMGCPREKVQVYRLGVDLQNLPFVPRQIDKDEPVRILIAGRFVEKKGIPYALEAIGLIKNKYQNIKVTILGDSTGIKRDEQEKQKILDKISRYELEENVSMRGFQPLSTLLTEMYAHHIFLSPSVVSSDGDTEGGAPVTIIQALASGMPVVSTTHCDIPGVIQHNVSGLLAPERDSESLAHQLDVLLTNQEKWINLETAGRDHIEKEFNAQLQGQKLLEIYRRFS
jgi:colanic acid/amylovoran biosynthesis glycosyltransferase